METLSEGINELKEKGYREEFWINENGRLISSSLESSLMPKNIEIKIIKRYEGSSNPSDMSVLYGLETKSGLKGILINSYGAKSDGSIDEFILSAQDRI